MRDRIVRFIASFHKKNGYAPTVREVGRGVGLKSPATIHHHLTALRFQKRIAWEPKFPRTLRVLEQPRKK